ncbi:MAG TPA: phage holin family protein [Opitutaceae bacterium]|nr:phage holin family protein [Opitutaceae bacterium]
MEPATPASAGYLSSLRSLADGFLGLAQDRIQLFTLELQEEKFRLIQTFLWISAVVFTGMLALTFASLALVYVFWDSARLAVLSGLALFYTGSLVAIVVAFRRYLVRQPNPFDATLREIGEDRECIRPPN